MRPTETGVQRSGHGNYSLEVLAGDFLQLGIGGQADGALGALVGVLHEQPHPRIGDRLHAEGRHQRRAAKLTNYCNYLNGKQGARKC